MQKVGFKPTKSWDIDYAFHFSETSKYNRYDRLYVIQTQGPYKKKLRWAEWYYGPQKWRMHRVGISHAKANVLYDQVRLVGAAQYFEESRYDREFMVRELRMQKETVEALSIKPTEIIQLVGTTLASSSKASNRLDASAHICRLRIFTIVSGRSLCIRPINILKPNDK